MNAILQNVIGLGLLSVGVFLFYLLVFRRRIRVSNNQVLVVYGRDRLDRSEFASTPGVDSAGYRDLETVRCYRGGNRPILPTDGYVFYSMDSIAIDIKTLLVSSDGLFFHAKGQVVVAPGNNKAAARRAAGWLPATSAKDQLAILESAVRGGILRYCSGTRKEAILNDQGQVASLCGEMLESVLSPLGFRIESISLEFAA